MATSGPITYLVMEDQFPFVAAPRERPPKAQEWQLAQHALNHSAARHGPRSLLPDRYYSPALLRESLLILQAEVR